MNPSMVHLPSVDALPVYWPDPSKFLFRRAIYILYLHRQHVFDVPISGSGSALGGNRTPISSSVAMCRVLWTTSAYQ